MLAILSFALASAICSRSSPLDWPNPKDNAVQLPTGKYIGYHDAETSITTYYAIPYAYSSRFQPSKPIDTKPGISPDDVINASTHGPACINFNLPPPFNKGFSFLLGTTPIEPQSEDCLNFDVYVPDGDHKDLPVLFFTPGGGFLVGASFIYDMKTLLSRAMAIGKPFIAVSINYRLGPLGFLNPSTWGENLNLGLLDQVEALKYVHKYISAFGGSPEKVTISGQSAGGESTMQQFLWTDEDLFRSAWIMSSPTSTSPYLSEKPAFNNKLVKEYAAACGCPAHEDISAAVVCLRTTSISTLTNNSAAWQGSMTSLGGSLVRHNIFDTIRAGKFPKVPVMVSTTRDEGTVEALGFHPNNTKTTSFAIENLIAGRGLQGKKAKEFLQQMLEAYPNNPALGCPFNGEDTNYGEGSQYKRMAAIATDGTYTEGWSEIVKTLSLKTKTWGLYWEQPIPGAPAALGVTHGSDLAYYFPDLNGAESNPSSLGHKDLMNAVQDALINFVHFGDPNGCSSEIGSGGYYWPPYGESQEITVMNASLVAEAQSPPHRPGFDIIHEFLRPGPF